MALSKMSLLIKEIIKTFETPAKNKKEKYKNFLIHVYSTFENKIKICKTSKLKNKYIQMRTNALKYIVNNERAITAEICKNK